MTEKIDMFTALRKYAQFGGRASRKEYWLFILLNFLVGIVLQAMFLTSIFLMAAQPESSGQSASPVWRAVFLFLVWLIALVWNLGVFIPGWAVTFRRLHDSGRSGWWWLIGLIPLVGGIVLLIFMLLPSDPGDNRYGHNPYAEPEQD